jgi:UDP-N-acetylmuramoylalanine--D-glutamate ligase
MNLNGKKALVYGLAKSGLSALRLLEKYGALCFGFDDDENKRQSLPQNAVWTNDFSAVDIIVVSPSIPLLKPEIMELKLSGKTVISEIELAHNFCNAEIIAVSGTNGKTTTTMLIDEILRAGAIHSVAAGNIGTPFCDVCDSLKCYETAVVEVSSFQLEGIVKFSPDVSVLLNITPDHLDRHKSLDEYIRIKSRLFENQTGCDLAVVNADDINISSIIPSIQAKIVPFSATRIVDGVYIENGYVKYFGTPVLCSGELNFKGKELENILAAVAVAMEKHIHPFVIACAIKRFKKPAHRLQSVGTAKGKRYIDDSKATNIDATLCACSAIDSPTLLILGGQERGDDFRNLFIKLPKNVRRVFACGENAKSIAHAGRISGFSDIWIFDSFEACVAASVDCDEDVVLFSPASKSFDRYVSYAERGDHFRRLVGELDD